MVKKDGQSNLAGKYTSVEQASYVGPSFFQKDGLGRLDHRPRVAGGEGQPILASVWAPLAYKTPWDELDVNARLRLALCQLRNFSSKTD